MNETDLKHLERCVELAREALDEGSAPFGSVLVAADGTVLAEDHNRTAAGDGTAHPELAHARWAATHLTPEERAGSTVYTSGEHCPMCAAAHAWAGLGRIVFAVSTSQYAAWCDEAGVGAVPVASLPVSAVAPGVIADGPYPEFEARMRELHSVAFVRWGGAPLS